MKRTKLERIYDSYNRKYFKNKLPKIHVNWDKRICPYEKALGVSCNGGPDNNHAPHIEIATQIRFSPRWTRMCLLHEMVHIEQKVHSDRLAHGKKFHLRMLDLAGEGAFLDLW